MLPDPAPSALKQWFAANRFLLVAAGVVVGLALVGLFLWWPDRDSNPVGRTDLGTQLVGGSVVALAILFVQIAWDGRLRNEENSRATRLEAEEEARRARDLRWENLTVRALTDQHRERVRLLLNIVLQMPSAHLPLDLRELDLSDLILANRDLTGALLSNSVLRNANMNSSILVNADLTGAQMNNSILDDADLQSANLNDARLNGASMKGTKLAGAQLQGANLVGAIFDSRTTFQGAKADDNTSWPQGFDLSGAGVISS